VIEAAQWATDDDTADNLADNLADNFAGGRHSPQATLMHLQIITGLFHFERGHFRAGFTVAEQAIETCRTLKLDADLLLALLLYGRTQMRRGAAVEATGALQEALALDQRLGSSHNCAEALISLGMVASSQGHYTEAQSYLQQALALVQEMGYRPWIARALTNLGTTYSRQHDYQQAKPYYEQALAIALEAGDQNFIMITISNLGGVYAGFGQVGLSLDYYQRSLAMARNVGDERWIAANLNGLANTYLATGALSAAERVLREALAVGQQSDSAPDTLGSIACLGHVFARRGQLESALKALTFVEQHLVTMARDRLYNEPLLTELRSELPPTLFEQAAAWATGQTLDGVVHLHALLDGFRRANIMLWSSPTYHGTVSGVFKNALDFAELLADDTAPYLTGQAVGLISINDSSTFAAMRDCVHELRAWLTPTQVLLSGRDFNPDLTISNPQLQKRLERMVAELIVFARKHRE